MTRGRTRLAPLLRRPGYRRLWTARAVSSVGDVAQFTTLALLLVALTDSGLGVSGAVLAEIAPVLLLGPLAGSLVDRLPRVRVMIAADLVRMTLAGGLAVWHDSPPVAYAVAFGLSAGAVFFNPAAASVLPALVDERELVRANSGIWSAAVTAQVIMAPLAGVVAATAGFGPAFALNAASFAVSALLLRGLRVPAALRPVSVPGPLTHAREGLHALAALPLLRALAVGQLLAALSAGMTSALLVLLARDRLGATGGGYGLLLAAIAVGAVTGPALLARVDDARRLRFVFAPYALRGVVDLLLAVTTAVPVAAAALVGYGVGTSVGGVTFTSLVQSHVPAELRGRAFAGFDVLWQSGRLVSLLLGGLIADALGIRAVFLLGGALLVVAAAAGASLAGRDRVTG